MRRLLSYTLPIALAVLFLSAVAITIFYAQGYHYDFLHKRIEKTGLVYLNSFPSSGNIYVDASTKKKKKTPDKVDNLLPGEHTIRVTKSGYIDWVKRVKVEAEKVIRLEHLLLFPKVPKQQLLTPRGMVADLALSSDGRRLLYSVNAGLDQGLWTANLDLSSPRKLLPLEGQLVPAAGLPGYGSDLAIASSSLSDNGDTALIGATTPSGTAQTVLLPIATPGSGIILNEKYADFGAFSYEKGQSRRLYAMRGDALYRIDTSSASPPALVSGGIVSYVSEISGLILLKRSGPTLSLISSAADGSRQNIVTSSIADGSYRLAADPASDRVSLLNTGDGQLRVISTNNSGQVQILIIGTGYTFATWSRDNDRLLYGGAGGAYIFDALESRTLHPIASAVDPANTSWLYDAYHVVTLEAGKISVREDDGQNKTDIMTSTLAKEAYSNNSKEIYGQTGGALHGVSTRDVAR